MNIKIQITKCYHQKLINTTQIDNLSNWNENVEFILFFCGGKQCWHNLSSVPARTSVMVYSDNR